MKPSDVILRLPPLAGTFGRAEVEHTAALFVFCCWQLGDTWEQAIGEVEIRHIYALELAHQLSEPQGSTWLRSFILNPYTQISKLACLAHPEWFAFDGDGFTFTEAGLERLAKWVPS